MNNSLIVIILVLCGSLLVFLVSYSQFPSLSLALLQMNYTFGNESIYFPIDIEFPVMGEPIVKTCPLKFETYRENPSKYPMFNDLVKLSCTKRNTKTIPFSELKETIDKIEKQQVLGFKIVNPTGFVFHASRCGSTVVANMLSSIPQSLVYSESAPPAQIIKYCLKEKKFNTKSEVEAEEDETNTSNKRLEGSDIWANRQCTYEQTLDYLRVTMKAMGITPLPSNSPSPLNPSSSEDSISLPSLPYTSLFFKFQSVVVFNMDVILNAFPTVPYIFLFRQPTQIMMSQFAGPAGKQNKGWLNLIKENLSGGKKTAPCLRGRSHPPLSLLDTLHMTVRELKEVPDEQLCAAHLQTLCSTVLEVEKKNISRGHSLMIDYSFVPSTIPIVVTDFFHFPLSEEGRGRMLETSEVYSKARNSDRQGVHYEDDSILKDEKASSEIKEWATHYLSKSYQQLYTLSYKKLSTFIEISSLPLTNIPLDASSGGGVVEAGDSTIDALQEPVYEPLGDILANWSPDDARMPADEETLAGRVIRFDYQKEKDKALAYRNAEIPFLLYNVPNMNEIKQKWTDQYLVDKFGSSNNPVTVSHSNSFMYYNKREANRLKFSYTPPTTSTSMKFKDWLDLAKKQDPAPNETHYYLLANSPNPHHTRWISKDLPIFEPKKSFFMVDEKENRGINCRFGMTGIIAEAHYDGGRNFIAMLRGAKRYILLPPTECEALYLYPRGHPEARHSMLDWTEPVDPKEFPLFNSSRALQIVLRAGEILYLPSYWFHYIVSLGPNISAQCNTRSGDSLRYKQVMVDCGFYGPENAPIINANSLSFGATFLVISFLIVLGIAMCCYICEKTECDAFLLIEEGRNNNDGKDNNLKTQIFKLKTFFWSLRTPHERSK